ncbi:sigma-70 family RNA polymerase sigma factor [Clostridium sp. AL.422]|uniref:sigma-70 family RNA polymerase sigma factor n=1 Tax=Clostridium TaxID=1485 RepID=UPI00293DCE85|nr:MULTISPECIES: sigma-70 family RNA polymerase sigma factor [unclassified Clostridium]MDV4151657.1 sigma-70 family RNA polymerase sigma factor [Clostridium sp. AL.422]
MEDNEILLDLINGYEFALDNLSRAYGKLIYGVINKILCNYSEINDIDECFNDVLIAIWRNIDCYDSTKGSLRNFLISVAKYKAIDYKRKINKRAITLELKEEIIDTEVNENIEVDNKDFYILLNNLKEEDKTIFIRKYLFEESVEKIAVELGLSKDVIYKRISRGKEKIRNDIMKK